MDTVRFPTAYSFLQPRLLQPSALFAALAFLIALFLSNSIRAEVQFTTSIRYTPQTPPPVQHTDAAQSSTPPQTSQQAPEAQPLPWVSPHQRWLLVDASSQTLSVMRGAQAVKRFDNVSLGRRGTQPIHYQGDTSTPLGEMYIDDIRKSSNYTLFFSLNYPTAKHALIALKAGKITTLDYLDIFNAEREGRKPPYRTPLGGEIGIHGLGHAKQEMHREFNWTRGCVALDNQQIRTLAHYVFKGMLVVIR
ncbi:Hypothetical protein HDN1F_37850 [gamma proteobacterium HdN1]|nr:Hypothetical protein HDN1F_37850 [gamma proteobacterium HdN1]